MKTSHYLLASLAFVVAAVFWSHSQDDFEPMLVATVGKHSIDKSADIHVFADDNDLLNITYSIDGSKQEWVRGFIDPNTEWFIYVSRRNEIWLVDDKDVTLIFDFDGGSGSYGLFNCHDPNVINDFIHERVPSQLVMALPKRVIDRIEEAKRSGNVLKMDETFVALAPKI